MLVVIAIMLEIAAIVSTEVTKVKVAVGDKLLLV